jgi:hypothetical protein
MNKPLIITLTKEEKEALYISASCRLGFIETGEIGLRHNDAINSGQQKKIKVLSHEQKKLVVLLEELMLKLL